MVVEFVFLAQLEQFDQNCTGFEVGLKYNIGLIFPFVTYVLLAFEHLRMWYYKIEIE